MGAAVQSLGFLGSAAFPSSAGRARREARGRTGGLHLLTSSVQSGLSRLAPPACLPRRDASTSGGLRLSGCIRCRRFVNRRASPLWEWGFSPGPPSVVALRHGGGFLSGRLFHYLGKCSSSTGFGPVASRYVKWSRLFPFKRLSVYLGFFSNLRFKGGLSSLQLLGLVSAEPHPAPASESELEGVRRRRVRGHRLAPAGSWFVCRCPKPALLCSFRHMRA